MKKILFGVAALGLLGLAGAGIGLKAQDTVEAKAETTSIYCVGKGFTHAYSWYKEGESESNKSEWPGDNMEKVADGLYKIDLDLSQKNRIIFNDGSGNQTEDLVIDPTHTYFQKDSNIWSDVQSPSAGYYLVGNFSNWNISAADSMAYDSDSNIAYIRGKTISATSAGDSKVKAIHYTGSSVTWIQPTGFEQHDLVIPGSGHIWHYGEDLAVYFTGAGSVTTDIAAHISGTGTSATYHFADAVTPTITVGSKNVVMENYIENFDEYTAVIPGASAGDGLAIEEKTVTPNVLNSNNLTSDKKVKVGGDISVYYNKSTHSTWVSGYSAPTSVIQDFCDSLLALGCEATNEQLAALNWSGEGVKTAINGATIALGDDKSYTDWGNVVNEAATRYVNLISNGLSPIDGVTLASRTVPGAFEATASHDSPVLAISITSIAALVAISTFFIVRKRKEDR